MTARMEFIRYMVVGLTSNFILYAVYIGLTELGMVPKFAMSLLYGMGVIQTFIFNKRWSFRFEGATTPALMRYVTAHAICYAINLGALVLLVDQRGLPHQWVQGVMIFVIAVILFLAQRYWIFPRISRSRAE